MPTERRRGRRRRGLHQLPSGGPRGDGRTERRRRRQRRRHLARRRPQRGVAARLQGPSAPQGRAWHPRQGQGPARSSRRIARDQGADRDEGERPLHRRGVRRAEQPGRPVARGGRRPWRARQREVPVQQAAGAELRRAGRTRRGAVAQTRTPADGRRGARRIPQRRQVDADQRHLGGQAEDRELSVHHARAEPRAWSVSTTRPNSSSPTSRG